MADHYGFNDQRGPYKGVRVVITTNEDTPPATYDGVTLNVGDPVLLTGQTNKEENGLREVGPSTWSIWRYMKLDEEIKQGMLVHVAEGTSYGGSYWRLDTAGPYVLDTTELEFSLAFWPAAVALSVADFSLAQSVLAATTVANPAALQIEEGGVLGRPSGGDVESLDSTQLKAIVGAANTTQTGVVELADQTEVDAGTDTIRPVVSSRLAATTVVHRQRPAVVSVGAPDASTVDVAFKVVDGKTSPADVEEVTPVTWWLSSDNTTGAKHGTTPDGGATLTTGVELEEFTADLSGIALTNATGDATLQVVHSGGAWTGYLWLRAGQTTVVSSVITIT
jgi:hypothetical protein